MKKVYFLLIASAMLLMASCAQSSDYDETDPVKQEQVVPTEVKVLNETGVSRVASAYPFYAVNRYTMDNSNGGTEYNTAYFFADADYTTPLLTEYDVECKYSVWHCGIYGGEVELLSLVERNTIIIPKGVSSYVLYQGPYRNMMGGYDYHRYAVIESMRYVNMQ